MADIRNFVKISIPSMMGIVSPRRFLLFWIPFFLVLWDPGKHFSLYRDNIVK